MHDLKLRHGDLKISTANAVAFLETVHGPGRSFSGRRLALPDVVRTCLTDFDCCPDALAAVIFQCVQEVHETIHFLCCLNGFEYRRRSVQGIDKLKDLGSHHFTLTLHFHWLLIYSVAYYFLKSPLRVHLNSSPLHPPRSQDEVPSLSPFTVDCCTCVHICTIPRMLREYFRLEGDKPNIERKCSRLHVSQMSPARPAR